MGDVRFFEKDRGLKQYSRTGLKPDRIVIAARQRLWKALRGLHPASQKGLAKVATMSDTATAYYLGFLECAGYLWREPVNEKRYFLLKNTGPKAPQRLRGGRELYDPNTSETIQLPEDFKPWPGEPARPGSDEHKAWKAMCMLRNFTASEIVSVTEVDEQVVAMMVKDLHQFTYLRETEPSMGEPSYMLPQYRNTGDRPPAISHKLGRLYDFKTKEIITLHPENPED